MTETAWAGPWTGLDEWPISPDPAPLPSPPPPTDPTVKLILWSGWDGEGKAASGSVPVRVTPRPVLCPVTPSTQVDQSAALASWVRSLPAGTPADFGSTLGRTYRVDRSVTLNALPRVDLLNGSFQVSAPSTELDAQGRSLRRHLWLTNCSAATVRNVTVRGQNLTDDTGQPAPFDGAATYDPKREWEHGLAVEDCPDVTVDGFTADGVFGDGMYFRRTTGSATNFTVSRNGRQGVGCLANMSLTHGRIVRSRRSGIDLEPNSADETYHDIELGWLDIHSNLIPITSGGPGVVRDVWVHDITSRSWNAPNISLRPNTGGLRLRWTVERFTCQSVNQLGSPLAAVELRDVKDVTLRDVTIPCQPARAMTGVNLTRPDGRILLERVNIPGAARLTNVTTPGPSYSLTVVDCAPAA